MYKQLFARQSNKIDTDSTKFLPYSNYTLRQPIEHYVSPVYQTLAIPSQNQFQGNIGGSRECCNFASFHSNSMGCNSDKCKGELMNPNNNVKDPTLWGPHLWAYLHFSTANYPDKPSHEEIENMKAWLCSLYVTIPCDTCSQHYKKYIDNKKNELDDICSCREKLFRFMVDIHNKVNLRTGKPTITYEQAKQMYLH